MLRSFCSHLALSVAILAIPVTSVVAQTGSAGDSVSLAASPLVVNPGAPVALSATVTPSTSGGPTPTGTVQFAVGTDVLGTVALSSGVAKANLSAVTTGILPGTYNVTATYSGDSNYASAVSPVVACTINGYGTVTTLSVGNTSVKEGGLTQLTATVTAVTGSNPPTGSVAIVAGGSTLTTIPLVNGVASLDASTAGIAGGVYSVKAVYSGDSYNATSTSTATSVTVLGTTTTAVTFGTTGYAAGQTASVTATVTAVSGGTPTGTVQFSSGSTVIGTAPLTAGVATLTNSTAGLAAKSYPVTATYLGSSTFQSSTGSASIAVGPAYAITPSGTALSPSGTTQFALSPAASAATWYVNNIAGGNSTVGTIDSNGNYTAPATATAETALITAAISSEPTYAPTAASAYVIPAGTLTATANPYTAQYSISLPAGAQVAVNFGQTTAYGLNTWQVAAPSGGGTTTVLVAGMIAGTQYHLQGSVSLPGSVTFTDKDNTFTPPGLDSSAFPAITIDTNTDPQPGIEIADNITYLPVPVYAFDLDGNIIWAYSDPTLTNGDIVQPVKMLSNGHMLMVISPNSAVPLGAGVPTGSVVAVREVDLTGATIQQLDLATINANLVTAGYTNLDIQTIHHEILILPNGHWLLIGNILVPESNVTGYTGTVNVLGDVILDIDPNNNFSVDWVWNEFDHLDVNRHPYMFPDWTHTNALAYSADDGNLLVSLRHQNWVVKVNYSNGAGDGSILWHLGAPDTALSETADFTLLNADGTTDTDLDNWQYAQHNPNFTTSNTTGVFGLSLMDNGTDRGVYTTGVCGGNSTPACYTTAPVFTVDETNMTVTRTFPDQLAAQYYSFFGGSSNPQANGDVEYDLASYPHDGAVNASSIQESTTGATPEVVWQADNVGEWWYRAFRAGSLYPGVTWTPGAGVTEVWRKKHLLKPGEKPATHASMGHGEPM